MAHHHKKALLHNYRKSGKHLMASLARALILHESINVTITRAKALRAVIEPMITLAKKSNSRRLFILLNDGELTKKMVNEIGRRFSDRAGGYTRIVRTHVRSDGTTMAQIAFV